MTAIGTLPVVLGTGIHSARPAASAVGGGGLYSCTTHNLVYQTDGSSWTTWATLGAAASGSITASGYTQATAKMLGRSTASTGAIEEITVGSGLSLSAGSLTATGGSAGALVFLEAHTASSSATLDFTTFISSAYDEYMIDLVNIIPATNNQSLDMRMGTGGGPTYDSGTNYGWFEQTLRVGGNSATGVATGQSAIQLAGLSVGVSNSALWGVGGSIRLMSPQSTSLNKQTYGQTHWFYDGGSDPVLSNVMGVYISTTALTALRFLFPSGNIASGTIRIYGLTKS